MREARWEIATHGLKWIDYRDFTPEAAEAAHLDEAIALHESVVGERPAGVYVGRTSEHTQNLCGRARLRVLGRLLRRRAALLAPLGRRARS